MATSLGRLTLDLVARTGQFIQDIRNSESEVSKSLKKMREGLNTYGALVGTTALAVGGAMFAMGKEFANTASELENLAFISKTSTQELQAYGAGAESVGIPIDALASQFKDFNEKLGEFITLGSGGATDFFDQIATKTEGSAQGAKKLALEMQNLSGPQALQLYVNKLEEAGVTQQQMSFYLESMAGDTTNLIPLLKNGGEGFKFWADEAKKAGLIIDESGIQKAAELNVQLSLLDLRVKGAKNQFIQGFMPSLVKTGDALSGTTEETKYLSDAGEILGNVFTGVAAIAIGLYTTIKLVTNAIAGLAVDAVKAKGIVDAAAESSESSWYDRLPGVKLARTAIVGAAIARAPNSGTQMAMEDNSTLLDNSATAITKLFTDAVNGSIQAMTELRRENAGAAAGLDTWAESQNEAAKAAKKLTKANQDLNQSFLDRQKISYDFASREEQMKNDYENQVLEISKAGFGSAHQAELLNAAKNRYAAESDLYLAKLAYELTEYKLNEDAKLNFEYSLNTKEIQARTDINDADRKSFLIAAKDKHSIAVQWLRLEQAERLNNAQESFQTDLQNMSARYAFERERILLNKALSDDDKNALTQASFLSQDRENDNSRQGAWNEYQNEIGIDTSASDDQSRRDKVFKAAFEWQLITQEEYQKKLLDSEKQYQMDRAILASGSGESIAGSFADMFKTMSGEQSTAYKAMFAVQKGFAIAQSLMAIQTGIANAMSLPFPSNLAAAATVAMETANIVSAIQSVALSGMAHDGIDNVPKEGTWLLDKGERVVDSRTNSDLKNYLASGGSGGDVTIQVNVTDSGVSSSGGNTQDQKQLGQVIGNAVRAVIRQEQRQGGLLSR